MTYRIIAVLTLLLGLSGWFAFSQYEDNLALRVSNQSLAEALDQAVVREEKDRALLVARQATIASQARKLAQAQQGLSQALQRNSDWSNTNVPTDVQNALGGGSGGPAGVQ